jgi:transcriptional regulator GlxA family with amidase domain
VRHDVFVEIAAAADRPLPPSLSPRTPAGERANPQVIVALQLIDERFGERLTVRTIAATLGISTEHLCRLLKRHTGDTFMTLLRRVRIRAACQLLRTSTLSMKEIAGRVGFSNPSQFDRAFKKICDVPPTAYRRASVSARLPES